MSKTGENCMKCVQSLVKQADVINLYNIVYIKVIIMYIITWWYDE